MNPTKEIYSLRSSFSIIGLTGRMGSGCTKVSDLLSKSKEDFFSIKPEHLRKPENIKYTSSKENNELFKINLFKRKYKICYNFSKINWKKYVIIDYKKALLLYSLDYIKHSPTRIDDFYNLVNTLFSKATGGHDDDIEDIPLNLSQLKNKTSHLLNPIFNLLLKIKSDILEIKNDDELSLLHELFFIDSNYSELFNELLREMEVTSYYLRTYFFHKLANKIRESGSPWEYKDGSVEKIYTVAKFLNRIIKAYKSKHKKECHIVINSLKNSLEIMFFKERYSAFYIAAVHNDDRHKTRIEDRIPNSTNKEVFLKKLIELDEEEYDSSSFKKGHFAEPDLQNCIQKGEIHISNEGVNEMENDFSTIEEQLLKVQALIQQPGIITPTNIERCMQIAYNSKFNSGCISRQVGAVVTDETFAIKSVGWNDVPKNTISCLFRDVDELIEEEFDEKDKSYSEFESKKSKFLYKAKADNSKYVNSNFANNLQVKYKGKTKQIRKDGKNCPFCFKSLHNEFEGFENQVHTRSLHAEENAMLQISKHGGQPLENGVLFTTASPCELCSKKAYQLGIKTVYYIDPYPGISMEHVLKHGYGEPKLKLFKGIIGRSFNKLYEPFISYKDEVSIYMQ